jgi:hypothetical protein
MMYRVDLADGGVEKASPEEEALQRLQARLRKLAVKINEAPEGEEKAELRREYRALQKRLRELGGDAPVGESYPGDDLAAFVDGLVADFTGNPAEQERDDLPEPRAGLDEFMARIAARDDGSLPPSVREDAELQDALRAQAHDDHFGESEGDNLSDEEAWSQYRRAIGEEA